MTTPASDNPIREGRDVYAPDGTKVGTISKVYPPVGASDETWIAVDAGVSDGPYLVPSDGAGTFSEGLQIRHTVEEVQGSPHVSVGDELTDAQLGELSEYYGLTARTSLNPGSPRADETPVSHAPGGRPAADGDRPVPVGGPGVDLDEDSPAAVDGPRPAGAVTVSGADGDVDLDESDELHATRADARAAAGYATETETGTPSDG